MGPIEQLEIVLPELCDVAAGIRYDQLELPTPCDRFTVHDVLDHPAAGGTDLDRGLAAVLSNLRQRSVLFLISDFVGAPPVTALQRAAARHDVVVVELANDLSVTLPISRAEEQLRPPATEADLKKVQKALREQGVVSDEIWSKRVQQAQGDIAKTQQQIDTLQRALNDLSANLYGASRTQQIAQMEQAQKQLATSRQQLTDLEEEGRRNGWR